MRKFYLFFLALVSMPMLSCTPSDDTANRKPIGLTTDESDMPWNRPTGPEGGGPLGFLGQQ